MNNLPTEVIESIMVTLDMKSLIRMSQVCTRFREIVARRHFHAYLSRQEWSVIKQLRVCGWSDTCDDVQLLVTLFWQVTRHLDMAWTQGHPSHRHGCYFGLIFLLLSAFQTFVSKLVRQWSGCLKKACFSMLIILTNN